MKIDETPEREAELDKLEVNLDVLSLEIGKIVEIARGSDFRLLAEKLEMTSGLAIYLEMEGKREVVDYHDAEELEELEEELRNLEEDKAKGIPKAQRLKSYWHRHKGPKCKANAKPDQCGHRSCGDVHLHVVCFLAPPSTRYWCLHVK